jgi:hypothetical protein
MKPSRTAPVRRVLAVASAAKSFLLLYNRRSGALEVREFSGPQGRARALKGRFEAERGRTDKNLEVVVVNADTLEEVKDTHGRYFLNTRDLTARAVRAGLAGGLSRAADGVGTALDPPVD